MTFIALLLVFAGCGGKKEEQAQRPKALVPANLDSLIAEIGVDTMAVPAGETLMTEPVDQSTAQPVAEIPVVAEIKAVPAKAKTDRPAPVKKIAPGGAFSLQVGSFRQEPNALNLAAKIKERGYPAVVEVAEVGGITYHRVFIRGLAERSRAENIGEELRTGLGINYLVLHSN